MEQLDFQLLQFIQWGLHSQLMDTLMPIIRNKLTWIPLYIILIVYLLKRYTLKNVLFIIGSIIVLIILSDVLCAFIIKPLVHRIRPCELYAHSSRLINYGLCSSTYSFPSCHATNHMALATYISYYIPKKWIRVFLYIWVASICIAQIYVGVHYPSDVLGGVFLGYSLANLMRKLVLNSNFNRLDARL